MKLINQKTSSTSQDHPEIQYPCTWTYKVIGENVDLLKAVITEACSPHPVKISHSNSSSKGKYHSFNAELVVPDEMIRLQIYELLKNSSAVRIVL